MASLVELYQPEFDGDGYFCHSRDDVLVLEGRYDPDQYWLDFGETLLFRRLEVEPKLTTKSTGKMRKDGALRPDDLYLVLYFPEKGVNQHPLPFANWQIPSRSMSKRIRQADFPCFERDEEGRLYAARYLGAQSGSGARTNDEFKAWVSEHCIGRVIADKVIVFEKAEDHILALISGKFSKL